MTRLQSVYTLIDAPAGALAPSTRTILEAVRAWAGAAGSHRCPLRPISNLLGAAGKAGLVGPLHHLLCTLASGASRPITIGNSGAAVSEDEALLLVALNAVQNRDLRRARVALVLLARADALEDVIHALAMAAFAAGPSTDVESGRRAA